jgi:RNA polymerase sigma factor (sigma-70 family)
MGASAPAQSPPNGDYTYQKLVKRVISGNQSAWTEFVEQFSNLLFSLIWRYANGDQDLCANLYLYVIEGLHQTNEKGETFYRLRRYLQSVSRYNGKGRLTTWLGRVTQNLVSDYFREQDGRRTLPRAIQRLELTNQKIFKMLYWDNLSERDAYETICSQLGSYSRTKFDQVVLEINNKLKTCNRWSIYSEVIRKTPALPLHPLTSEQSESSTQVQVADPNPASQPSKSALIDEQEEAAQSLGAALRETIRSLDDENRMLLVCRFKHGMTAGEIAKLLKRKDEKKIYGDLERLKKQLKESLKKTGFDWENVAGGIGAIDGLLDEFDRAANMRQKQEKS